MDHDTEIGGPARAFPPTRRSVVAALRSAEPPERHRAFEEIVAVYWKPIYKYLRIKWAAGNDLAKDLTQGFLAQALATGELARYDPARASFRTWLRLCVDGFVANERKAARRLKRGGGMALASLDFAAAEGELATMGVADPSADPEVLFHQEWVRELLSRAVDDLRSECAAAGKEPHFALFEKHDLEAPATGGDVSHARLAAEFGLTINQVNNHLSQTRRRFREIVWERLRRLCGSDQEFQAEARALLGGDPP